MVFLFCFMVLALTTIPSVKSQEGNFAQFGVNAGDASFTGNDPKGGNSRYVEWKLRKDIPAFGKKKYEKILVSKCLRLNNRRIYNYHYHFNPTQRLLLEIYPCRILKTYFYVKYNFLNKKVEWLCIRGIEALFLKYAKNKNCIFFHDN